jgi:hypothetical protein
MIVYSQLGRVGRFGNSLFQVASTIGIGARSGQNVGFPKWINHDAVDRFGSKENPNIYEYFIHSLPEMPTGVKYQPMWVQWGYHNIVLPSGNYDLGGHMQSFRYFEHCANRVKYLFEMHPLCRPLPDGTCAIHLRAGDYQEGQEGYHPRMPREYYERAMSAMPAGTRYYVFSDDPVYARSIIGSNAEYVEGNDYMTDFYMMRTATHFIICNSTYSAMAAWLGNKPGKKVSSPSGYNWFGDCAGINGDDIIHEKWITVKFDKLKKQVA